MHVKEIAGWLPAPMLLALVGALLFWFERRDPGGLRPLTATR
jgi:hypothetical protein